MADKKISDLTEATSLTADGSDLLVLVQGGTTKKVKSKTLLQGDPVSESIVANGAFSTTKLYTKFTSTTSTGVTYTLAAGLHGQRKNIVCSSYVSGTAVCTVTSGAMATLTWPASSAAAKAAVELINIDAVWYIVGNNGVTVG